LPLAVIHELDNFKGLEDQRGLHARSAIRFLDGLRPKLHQGVHLIETIITHAGRGTKLVITGDIQQIDNCRLTATNNGFVTLIEAFKGQRLYAHITLNRTERSSLAALGVELL